MTVIEFLICLLGFIVGFVVGHFTGATAADNSGKFPPTDYHP